MLLIKEWEELAKTQPDGTVKRYRRRVVVVQIIKKPKDETPNKENEELSKKPAVVEELPIQYDEIEVDESNPEFEKLADDPVSREQKWNRIIKMLLIFESIVRKF